MKKISLLLLFFIACIGCTTKPNYVPATDGTNAAVTFIYACLKGEFDKANFYMLQDEENKKLLKEAREKYASFSKQQKRLLREASLQNINIENITVNELILHYTNSANNQGGKVKALLINNAWLVDFKYKFNPNL
jgi:hypothetical protein